jgi:hypothetical protein
LFARENFIQKKSGTMEGRPRQSVSTKQIV